MLTVSLSTYGIERELRIEEDADGKHPEHWPVNGSNAAIAHMIADGIGDLRDEHKGRLAQIGFATLWEQLHGPNSFDKSWVWCLGLEVVK